MIRLNAFFEVSEGANLEQIKSFSDELVEKSRQGKGYNLFRSSTNPSVYMFCESWDNEEVLNVHSKSEHFTRIANSLNLSRAN